MRDDVSVVIPFQGNDPHRVANLEYTKAWYESQGYQTYVGRLPNNQPWCKARAVHNAIRATDEYGTLIVADADSIPTNLDECVQVVTESVFSWAVPHETVIRLSREGSRRVLEGSESLEDAELHGLDQSPYKGVTGGGVVVLDISAWDEVPMDPAFIGWGQQDNAWGIALRTVLGEPYRGEGKLHHLWHPHPKRMTRGVGSTENYRVFRRYQGAANLYRQGIKRPLTKRLYTAWEKLEFP